MLRFYIKTALRTFTRNKAFALINLLGLSIGVAASVLIFIVVMYELRFDKHHSNYDNIYRLNLHSIRPTGVFHTPACPWPAGEATKEFPEVAAAALVTGAGPVVISNSSGTEQREFEEDGTVAFVEADFFQVFDYNLQTSGGFEKINEPNQVYLTSSIAGKYFGEVEPSEIVGQTIDYDNLYSLEVAGIMDDIPGHTDLPFEVLVSHATRENDIPPPNWGRIESNVQLYLLMNGPIDIDDFDSRIAEMVLRQTGENYVSRVELHLQPLSQIHYDERYGNFNNRTVSFETVWSIALVGLVLLITACINFINLATAQSVKRAKEVGIRKIMGSSRQGLIGQILSETAFLVIISTVAGLIMAYLFLPSLATMLNLTIDHSYFFEPIIFGFTAAVVLVMILLSGFYPGWVISSFQPLNTLKSNLSGGGRGSLWLRRILVTFQFATSQALIIGTIVVAQQMDYFNQKDLGFNKESILIVPLGDGADKSEALINGWAQIAGVEKVTYQTSPPSSPNRYMTGYTFPGADPNDRYFAELKMADDNYLETYQLELLAGRNYHKMDTAGEALITEKMAAEMGYDPLSDAIGQKVELVRGTTSTVVGLIRDFHTVSLQEEIIPVAVLPGRSNYQEIAIKFETANMFSTIEEVEAVWNEAMSNEQFDYQFFDESIGIFYENERRTSMIFQSVTLIAIVIGCLGLYGLISFISNNRMKEVGIRKTLGAGVKDLVILLTGEFFWLVMVAFLIAAPLGYYYMNLWLDGFAYRIDFTPSIFILSIIFSFVVALFTVGYKSFRAAHVNPVEILRDE